MIFLGKKDVVPAFMLCMAFMLFRSSSIFGSFVRYLAIFDTIYIDGAFWSWDPFSYVKEPCTVHMTKNLPKNSR